MIFQEAQQYLDAFINHEIHLGQVAPAAFKLKRIRQLLETLGNPHKNLRVIHVAGSKGKGSICALTASILQSAGYKVGLYTSPHINNYRERIRVLENVQADKGSSDIFPDCISEEELCVVLEEIRPAVEQLRVEKELGALTFFEVYTALALYYFRRQKVDFVVLETGLGGRLDATNAADSIVAVIAPISLEHTRLLGDTIAQIAQEKAAIIKDRRQKVVIAVQGSEARDVLEAQCCEFDIRPIHVGQDITYELVGQDMEGQTFNVHCRGTKYCAPTVYSYLKLPLLGRHQRDNAATSLCIIECLKDLGFSVPTDALREGFKNIFWPGRFEIVREKPLIILDSAHNGASAKMLAETVKEVFGEKKVVLVLGVSEDKDKRSICEELDKITDRVIFTKADHPRAGNLDGALSVGQALDLACKEADEDDVILVAGSIFVVSEARAISVGATRRVALTVND